MSLNITYGSFNFPDPKPFVEKEQTPINYGGLWGQKTKILLNGQVTGSSFNSLINNQQSLIDNLSKDYQTLKIGEDRDIFNIDIAKVVGIDFNQSLYVGAVDYQIEFECYESGFFNQQFGVIEPKNEYSFQENPDSTMTLNHEISAKGLNTSTVSNNSLENAKNFVKNLTGYNTSLIKPFAIRNNIPYNSILTEYSESIDRINSTYSIKEAYSIDISTTGIYDNSKYITRYTVNVNEDSENEFKTVSINGDITAGFINNEITTSDLRTRAESLNLKNICENFSALSLNLKPNSLKFEEDNRVKKVSFSAEFDTNKLDGYGYANAYFDYTININFDIINNLSTFSINGAVKCPAGYLKERYNKVLSFYSNYMNTTSRGVEDYLFNLTNSFYGQIKSSMGIPSNYLNNTANSLSVIRSPYAGEISVSADFQDNKGLNPSVEDSKKIKNIKYTIETLPIMDIFRPNPTYDVNGKYFIYELGKSKSLEKVNISLSIDFSKNISIQEATSLTKKYFNIIKSNYGYQGYIINNEQMSTFKYDKSEDIKYINYQSNLIRASNENDKPFLPGKVLK